MRTFFSRLLLVALLGVAVFAVIQMTTGPSGTVVGMTGLDPDELEAETFRLRAPARVAIDIAGSYEESTTPASDTTLAAYGWLVRLDDETVAWQMRAPRPERGTLVAVADTVALEAGTYAAYFASYGDPLVRAETPGTSLGDRVRAFLSRGGRTWVGDAGRWRFLVSTVGDADVDRSPDRLAPAPDVLWEARRVRDRKRVSGLVHVRTDATVGLRAVTEITGGVVADVGSVVRLGARDTVWTTRGPGTWAGGSLKNRTLSDSLALAPGVYRVAFETDRSHAYSDWTANPPWLPAAWGLRMTAGTGDVGELRPDRIDLPEIVRFECVGPDAEATATFTIAQTTDLLVVAVGEVSSGSAYDFAVLEEKDGTDWDDIWEQEDADLSHAGGADKNKLAVEALTLEPGVYRLRYETDGSHDCVSGYNSGGAPDGGLWGAALYALDPALDLSTLDLQTATTDLSDGFDDDDDGDVPGLVFPPDNLLLAAVDDAGDNVDRAQRFTLSDAGSVRVIALGEISSSTRYDYAQIARSDGRVVWEMTRENTRPGGGSDFHRRFDGPVALEAGAYDLRVVTDGSRSLGDFGAPSREMWGARVYRDTGTPPPPAPPAPADPPGPATVGAAAQPVGGLAAVQGRVRYPELARREGIEGEVVVRATVAADGTVIDPEIVSSPNPLLSEAALQAVLASPFEPARENGRAIRAEATVPVVFSLD